MSDILFTNARVLTLAHGDIPRRGDALRELSVIDNGGVLVRGGRIAEVSVSSITKPPGAMHIDAHGRVLMPTFVDCHTHACWAGERFDEFDMKLAGASYLDILKAGGGIMSTVRAVRSASEDDLVNLLHLRLSRMGALGTATVEVKSGYGLNTESELKMLRAIRRAAEHSRLHVVPTFLGAHAIDPDNPNFIEQTINETLPAVAAEFPGIVCDAYCEESAWSLDDTIRLFEQARDLGCPVRVHADQFNVLGMTNRAVEMGAISVDHLEASTTKELRMLARSDTMGVALPCSGFHLDDRYAPARTLIDMNGGLAIATNYNPGSAPTPSMPFTVALACRKLGLTPAEALVCATVNAAHVLRFADQTGTIEPGKRGDLQLLDCTDERELGYEIATPGPQLTLIGGEIVHRRSVYRTD